MPTERTTYKSWREVPQEKLDELFGSPRTEPKKILRTVVINNRPLKIIRQCPPMDMKNYRQGPIMPSMFD